MQENTETPQQRAIREREAERAAERAAERKAREENRQAELLEVCGRSADLALMEFAAKADDETFGGVHAGSFSMGVGYGVGFLVRKLGAAGISPLTIRNAIEAPDAE